MARDNQRVSPALPLLQVLHLERRLLRRRLEPALDALAERRQERVVAKVLPALLGLVDRDYDPAVLRRAGNMMDLTGGKVLSAVGMDRCDRGLVLLLRGAGEAVDDAVPCVPPLRCWNAGSYAWVASSTPSPIGSTALSQRSEDISSVFSSNPDSVGL